MFIYIKYGIFISYVYVVGLCACVSLCTAYMHPEEGVGYCRTGITDGCVPASVDAGD